MKSMGAVLSAFVMLVAAMVTASAQTTAGSGTVIVVPVTAQTASYFGLLVLTELAGVHPFYGYARVQNPQGIGFSVEGFPADNFNDQVSHATGLKKTTGGLIYQTNCFVGSLAEPATYTLKLFNDSTGAQIGATISGSLSAFQQVRYLDVFGPGGVNAAPANYANVRAEFAADPPATLVGFCTVQDNASFGADFRIGKSYGGPGTVVSLAQGTGIVLTPNPITSSGTIAVDPTVIQSRVSGTCPAGSSIRAIAQSGTVTCETDDVGGVGTVTSLSQGTGIVLTPNPITSSGTIAVDPASSTLTGNFFRQDGNAFGAVATQGTIDNNAVEVVVNGTRVMRYESSLSGPNVIGGHPNNRVGAFVGQTVVGGGSAGTSCEDPATGTYTRSCGNQAAGGYSTIGGGKANRTSGVFATVGGGSSNTASGAGAAVVGGQANVIAAAGNYGFIGGGSFNQTTAAAGVDINIATIGGGTNNKVGRGGATVAGGNSNQANGFDASVGGGFDRFLRLPWSARGGGDGPAPEGNRKYDAFSLRSAFACGNVPHRL